MDALRLGLPRYVRIVELKESEGISRCYHEVVVRIASQEGNAPFSATPNHCPVDYLMVGNPQDSWKKCRTHVLHFRDHNGNIAHTVMKIGLKVRWQLLLQGMRINSEIHKNTGAESRPHGERMDGQAFHWWTSCGAHTTTSKRWL